ncbi:ATP-binding cassette domain-containing protein [Martelella alba]|nr:ATP-binding cassette domain-containing protein [Martelella alba]
MSPENTPPSRLGAEHVTLGYAKKIIARDLSLSIPDGELTVIIGPNACGKSTLLRALARLLRPEQGQVRLDGREISHYRTKEVARRLGLLPQNPTAPGDILVGDLVARGRYPHQSPLGRWNARDEAAVRHAMRATGIEALERLPVDTLSGGQRQRVWIAMALAQQTPLLLLDEPTTWLDIAHQIDLLELLRHLNRRDGHTLVVVLHDLNHACRYATHLVAMREGAIVAQGAPADIVTAELVEQVFGLRCVIIEDPVAHTPMVVPLGREKYQPLVFPVDGAPKGAG